MPKQRELSNTIELDPKKLINETLEAATLGWLIQNGVESAVHVDRLSGDDFTDPQAAGIFAKVRALVDNGEQVDENKLLTQCRGDDVLEKYETFNFYKDRATDDIDWAVAELRGFSARRKLSNELRSGLVDLHDVENDIEALIQRIGNMPEIIQSGAHRMSMTPAQIQKEMENMPPRISLRHGNKSFDAYYEKSSIKGYVEGILGRTGHGKTRYAQKRANMLLKMGYTIGWIQLEGDRYETYSDFISLNPDGDIDHLDNLYIYDEYYSLEDITREARLLKYECDIDALFVDYLQEISAHGFRPSDVRHEKAHISKSLRRIAKELDILMVWLLQPSREDKYAKGWGLQPKLSDIIETSQIEKDCYVVSGVFRPNMVPDLVEGDKVQWFNHTTERRSLMPYDSVVVQQLKNRKLPRARSILHLIDGVGGMAPYVPVEDEYHNRVEVVSASDFAAPFDVDDEVPF